MDTPIHQHDCDECIFLGNHNNKDLYVHISSRLHGTTVIARHGIEGEYSSGMEFSYGMIPDLVEARLRAESRGLIKKPVSLEWD